MSPMICALWLRATARACPDCTVGRAARAQFWDDASLRTLAALLVPFVVIGVASIWADRLGRRRRW